MTITRIATAMLFVFMLTACQSFQDSPKQAGGTLLGAGLGALVGSQIGSGKGQLAAVAIGALGGAYLGSEIGKSLDKADRTIMGRNAHDTLERTRTGQKTAWRNPDSGHSGTFTPTRTFQMASGQPCREYQQTVTIGGRTENAYGTSCRQADGSWKIVQ